MDDPSHFYPFDGVRKFVIDLTMSALGTLFEIQEKKRGLQFFLKTYFFVDVQRTKKAANEGGSL